MDFVNRHFKILVLLVFVLALFMRLYKIDTYPVNLTIDEVAIGVNANLILHTAHDEWGAWMPLSFFSVGDYKPPVNIYLDAIAIAIFGLTEFSVRFPTALFGAATPVVLVLILKRLKLSSLAAIFGGVWLALSPWHIHFSRGSFEAITALFFLVLGLYMVLLWIEEHKRYQLPLSAAAFGLSVWSYHSVRATVPLLVVFLALYFRKQVISKKNRRDVRLFMVTGVLFAIPFFYLVFFTPAISSRAAVTSILRDPSLVLHHGNYSSLLERVFDNDIYLIFRHWMGKYLNYFDLRFWFWKAMNFTPPGYPDLGLMFLVDILVLPFSIYFVSKEKKYKKLVSIAAFFFFVGPLPASFTMNEQHTLRALSWVLFFVIILSYGFEKLVHSNSKLLRLVPYLYAVGLVVNVLYARDLYVNQYPKFYSDTISYGYREIAQYACSHTDEYDQIFVSETFGSREQFTSVPQLYLGFYCDTHPHIYTTETSFPPSLKGIYIKRPLWDTDKLVYKNALFIAAPWNFPDNLDPARIVKKLHFKDGSESFWFVETRGEAALEE